VVQTRAEIEAKKYEEIWSFRDYHAMSPGERYAYMFDEIMPSHHTIDNVIDLGCGAGAGGKALEEIGYNVLFLDHVLVDGVEEGKFLKVGLWDNWPEQLPLMDFTGYCCDVMEHIPTEYVGLVLERIKRATARTFFSIGLTDDHYGHLIQQSLHLTVKPYSWWNGLLGEFGAVVEARDLLQTGVFMVEFNK